MVPLFWGGADRADGGGGAGTLGPPGFWIREAGEVTPRRALDREIQADVVIVGGGYAGMWTAWGLHELAPDAKVVILEAGVCGEAASGRNAGIVTSLWHRADSLVEEFGMGGARAVCERSARSVDDIGEWARRRDADVRYRKAGLIKVATSAAGESRALPGVAAAARLGSADQFAPMTPEEVRERCASPALGGGAFAPQAATVQPALLARELRAALIDEGVVIHERSPARRLSHGPGTVVVETDSGARVRASAAVIALNAAGAGFEPLRNRFAVTSTHMLVTEPVPDVLEDVGWTGGEGISTLRSYLHYFRTTGDGRIAFGWGAGRVAYGARLGGAVSADPVVVEEVRRAMLVMFPGLRGRRVAAAWGGPIDVSPNRLPAVGTLPGGRAHYVYGFTGNGVGLAHLMGKVLASLVLDVRDDLTRLPLVEPRSQRVPPEPLRYLGGTLVRAALLRRERREDAGLPPGALTEAVVALPERFGLRIGR